jgi:hypothetical protein
MSIATPCNGTLFYLIPNRSSFEKPIRSKLCIYSIEYHNKKRGYTHIDFVYPLIFQGYEQSIKLFIARVVFT